MYLASMHVFVQIMYSVPRVHNKARKFDQSEMESDRRSCRSISRVNTLLRTVASFACTYIVSWQIYRTEYYRAFTSYNSYSYYHLRSYIQASKLLSKSVNIRTVSNKYHYQVMET